MMLTTDDLRISGVTGVLAPLQLQQEFPVTECAAGTTFQARNVIESIMGGKDDRLLVVMGPCSIHDPQAALSYANKLADLQAQVKDQLFLVMRVYFEKPRTTVGWKGFINDPDLDNSFNINKGLRLARRLLLDINELGVAAGTEFLDIVTGQYITDLISWGAIGARTTESQVHRELASSLSCAVGFKNGTDGNLKIAVDAVLSAKHPHIFLSPTKTGQTAIYRTTGNPLAHVILRGGKQPNYQAESVNQAASLLTQATLAPLIMIDVSHANSEKKYEQQAVVAEQVGVQIAGGDERIFGLMVESHLVAGRQDVVSGQPLTYGQSITDGCLGWEASQALIERLANHLEQRRQRLLMS